MRSTIDGRNLGRIVVFRRSEQNATHQARLGVAEQGESHIDSAGAYSWVAGAPCAAEAPER